MFARLRHDAIVRRDHQQHVVHGVHSAEHVPHESLVTRHVDEADGFATSERGVSETEVDGNTPGLLFGQAISVDTSERPN